MSSHLGEKTNGCKIPESNLQREKNVQGRVFNLDKLLVIKTVSMPVFENIMFYMKFDLPLAVSSLRITENLSILITY